MMDDNSTSDTEDPEVSGGTLGIGASVAVATNKNVTRAKLASGAGFVGVNNPDNITVSADRHQLQKPKAKQLEQGQLRWFRWPQFLLHVPQHKPLLNPAARRSPHKAISRSARNKQSKQVPLAMVRQLEHLMVNLPCASQQCLLLWTVMMLHLTVM